MDIRKYGIAIAVAILSAILIYSVADAFAPPVDYNRCYTPAPYGPDVTKAQQTGCTNVVPDAVAEKTCRDAGNAYEARYDVNGCVSSYTCNTCYKEQQDAQQVHNEIIFYVAVGLGLLFVIIGFLLPLGTVHEWVGLGLIIGGVIGMFIGTVEYWNNLSRWMRPVVILLELIVLLVIVYKRMNPVHDAIANDTPVKAVTTDTTKRVVKKQR